MGKGGGKQRTPYEAPNDLTSRQKLSIIDLVSEGPIEGPVGDLKGVYLNNTPVIDSSGNSNVNGMTAQWVSGTLEQPALEGFSSSSSETPVSIEIKKSTPVTRTITSRNIDRLRLTFGTQALVEVKDNGDRVGTSVELQIQVQRNGAWVTEKNITIRGKRSNSPYLMAVIIDKLPPPPFSIRMVRLTPDSNSDKLQNNTIWSSYTEITDINQTYPGSAVAGLTFESEQFGNQYPTRSYLVRGLIVQVPNNYDPETRKYSGIWDGTFKPAYTNNPAWVLYSLLTTKRFGLGKRLKIAEVDKFALYVIGQYCDELVPDGFGNKEPRVTCNAYITDIRKAYDYFSDLCSIMRIMPVWNGLQMTFVQDRPSDVVWPYTNANVVNGRFHYSFSPLKARHTVIEVRFIDPQNGWKTSVEQISDDALVAQFGLNVLRVDAFGCTSRGQARRYGLWILLTEKLETQTVEFEVGAEGLRHTPGDIIEIMDNDWVGGEEPIGGRLIALDVTQKILTLDREVTKPKSGTAFISLMNATGRYERVKVTGYLGSHQIKVESVPKGVTIKSVWGISQPDLARRLFRAITISDKGDGTYGVIAVQHVPEKEAIVDQGVKFEPLPDTPLGGYIPPIENLSVEVSADSDNWQVEANWATATAVRGVDFILKLTQAGRIVGTAKTQENRYRMGNLPQGNYLLSVAPQNKDGQKGEQSSVSFDINPPPPPSYIDVEPGFFSLGIIPHVGGQNALRLQYEFWFSEKQIANINEVELLAEYLGNGTIWVIQGRKLKAGQTYYVYVRTVNPVGKSQFVEANGKPEDRADEILEVIGDKFLSTEAGKELQKQIDFNKDHIEDLTLEQLEIKHDIVDIDSKTIELDNTTKELTKKTVEIESNAIDTNNKVLQLNTDVEIVNEAVMQNTQFITQVSFKLSEEVADRTAEIFRLEQVRVTDLDALARWQEQISVKVGSNTSSILEVKEAQATYEKATAQKIDQVKVDVDGVTGRVTQVETATATLTEAQATFERSTIAQFEEHKGYITNIETTVSNIDFTVSETLLQLSAEQASIKNEQLKSKAEITENRKAIATETQARTEMGVQMKTGFANTESAITEIKETQSEQGKTMAKTTEQLRSEIQTGDDKLQEGIDKQGRELSSVSSAVESQKEAIAELDKTTTTIKEEQQSNYNELHSNIVNLQQTQANHESSSAEASMQVAAQVNDLNNKQLASEAHIRRNDKAIAEQESALARTETELLAKVGGNAARIAEVDKVVSDLESTTAESAKEVNAHFKETDAKLLENQQAIAKESEARALSEKGLNTRIDKAESTIAQSFEAISEVDKAQTAKSEQLKTQLDEAVSVINTQASTLSKLDEAQTELKQTQQSNFEDNQASIANLQQTVASAEAANAESVLQTAAQATLLHDENLKSNARITHQEAVTADQRKAQAKLEEKVDAQYADNQATIVEIKKSVAEQGQSQAEKTEQLRAELKKDIDNNTEEIDKTNNCLSDVSAIVTNHTQAIAATDKTLTENEQKATSRFENNEASLANIQNTQANADSSQAESTLQLSVQQNQQGTELLRAKASIRENSKIVADHHKAYAQKFTQLDSQYEQTNARFTQIEETLADAEQSIVETKAQLQGEILTVDGRVSAVDQKVDRTKVTLENAIAESSQTLGAKVESAQGTANKAKTDAANAQQDIDKYKNSNDQRMIIAETQITSNKQAIANEQETRGSQINKINSELGGLNAAFEAQAKTYVDHKGNASSIFGIKNAIVVNGQYHEAQMIIGAEVKNGVVTTQIGFSADTFAIFNPSNGKLEPAFVVVNGQVVMSDALINKATIQQIVIGSDMRSKNYDPVKRTGSRMDLTNGISEVYGSDGEGSMIQKNNEISMYDKDGNLELFIGNWKGGNFGV